LIQLAACIAPDSIISYHTALELYGVAYSNFQQFTFLTSTKVKPFSYNGQLFQPVSQIAMLRKLQQESAFTRTEDRGGMLIRVTSLARTYVDALNRPELCGGWEEVYRSITNISAVDIEEIITYCLMLNSPVLCAKVGFFLEQRKGAFTASPSQLDKLLPYCPKMPYYIIQPHNTTAKLIKKWNLMIPTNILNQQWEEPDYDI
jgi:predicted transcriptional regulator of viral defense system